MMDEQRRVPLKPDGIADAPECSHDWVPAQDIPPPGEPAHWRVRMMIPALSGAFSWINLLPEMACPVCGEVLAAKAPPAKRRHTISEEPAEVYLHDYGGVDRRACETAKVNCVLTCDAVRGRKLKTVVLMAREVRPEETVIVPGSARMVPDDGPLGFRIAANYYTKGGDKRRAYTMTAEEARLVAKDLVRAADFAEGTVACQAEE